MASSGIDFVILVVGLLLTISATFRTLQISPKVFDTGSNIRLRVNNLKQPPIANAQYFIQLAVATYCKDLSKLRNWTCRYCPGSETKLVTFLQHNIKDTFGFVAIDSARKEIIVSFRGSSELKNWIEDFIFVPIPTEDPRIQVHSGFYLATLSLYDQVVTSLRNLTRSHPTYKVVLVGSSLGGAMAALTTFQLITRNTFPGTNYELYTYGEPREGNLAYARKFNSWNIPSARVVHYADLIPHLPMSTMGYIHRQNQLWIFKQFGNDSRYCSRGVYEDPKCSNSMGPKYNFSDHRYYFGVNITDALINC